MVKRQVAFWVLIGAMVGCGEAPSAPEQIGTTNAELSARGGEAIFEHVTFDGNGRTCSTCHSERSAGTISPEVVQARYARHHLHWNHRRDRADPLFNPIDSDDGVGESYTRLLTDATIRITLPLPPFVSLVDDPTARTVTYNRGVPTVTNIGLDPVLMQDGRAPDLVNQAASAINDHFEPGRQPSTSQLKQIALYEKSLYSSWALKRFANGGPAPTLPAGNTDSEVRGRAFFEPGGLCGQCHGGNMLNEMTDSSMFGPPGSRFSNVMVSEINEGNQPTHMYRISNPDGSSFDFPYTELGRVMITWDPADVGSFKIPTLWGVERTAPYFHDNSAKSLADVVNHYALIFQIQGIANFTDQDKADIEAYMKLL
jgi:cytochrome c peroxidase